MSQGTRTADPDGNQTRSAMFSTMKPSNAAAGGQRGSPSPASATAWPEDGAPGSTISVRDVTTAWSHAGSGGPSSRRVALTSSRSRMLRP
jgi:hypothetical protein